MSVILLNIQLTVEQVERAGQKLAEHPYNEVSDIVSELQSQGQTQVNAIEAELKKKKEKEDKENLKKVPN